MEGDSIMHCTYCKTTEVETGCLYCLKDKILELQVDRDNYKRLYLKYLATMQEMHFKISEMFEL